VVLRSRRLTRVVLGLLALVLAAISVDGLRWWRDERVNRVIRSGQVPAGDEAKLPELRFAKAQAQAASGADEAALDLYRSLQGDTPLGQAARYNSANALLRQALRVREGGQVGQAVPLIELAKETYREVLRNDPGHWNARYNLERAQRLLPDALEDEDGTAEPPPKAERAATTMRGYSPGLP
jgi:mxaK protein